MKMCEFRFYLPDLVHLLLDPVDEPPLDDPLNVLVLVLICHLDYYSNEGNKYFTFVLCVRDVLVLKNSWAVWEFFRDLCWFDVKFC